MVEDKRLYGRRGREGMSQNESRARRLGEYLEKHYNWYIWDYNRDDVFCDCGNKLTTKFCPACGAENSFVAADSEDQIEKAIQYALKENIASNNSPDVVIRRVVNHTQEKMDNYKKIIAERSREEGVRVTNEKPTHSFMEDRIDKLEKQIEIINRSKMKFYTKRNRSI